MSDSPCTGCRRTNNGRLFYAYVHHFMNVDRESRRVRLCKDCVFEMLAPLLEGADYGEGNSWIPCEAFQANDSRMNAPSSTATRAQPAAMGSPVAHSTLTSMVAETVGATSSAGSAGGSRRSRRSPS